PRAARPEVSRRRPRTVEKEMRPRASVAWIGRSWRLVSAKIGATIAVASASVPTVSAPPRRASTTRLSHVAPACALVPKEDQETLLRRDKGVAWPVLAVASVLIAFPARAGARSLPPPGSAKPERAARGAPADTPTHRRRGGAGGPRPPR